MRRLCYGIPAAILCLILTACGSTPEPPPGPEAVQDAEISASLEMARFAFLSGRYDQAVRAYSGSLERAYARDDVAAIAPNGLVSAYTDDGGAEATLPVREVMGKNVRFQFVLTYTSSAEAKANAVAGVSDALADGALRVGDEFGLPLTRFPLAETAAAHDAVQGGAVGKVLIDVA